MAWVACGMYGEEFIFDYEPYRTCVYTSNDEKINYWRGFAEGHYIDEPKELPKGSIKKLIGRELTWDNEPVELKEKATGEGNNNVQYQKWFWGDHILVTDNINNASVQVEVFNQQELKDEYRADALIYALYVDEPNRKRGIGKGLLQQAEQLARKNHCRVVALEFYKDETPRWTLEWYLRQGYNKTRSEDGYALLVKDLYIGDNGEDEYLRQHLGIR